MSEIMKKGNSYGVKFDTVPGVVFEIGSLQKATEWANEVQDIDDEDNWSEISN